HPVHAELLPHAAHRGPRGRPDRWQIGLQNLLQYRATHVLAGHGRYRRVPIHVGLERLFLRAGPDPEPELVPVYSMRAQARWPVRPALRSPFGWCHLDHVRPHRPIRRAATLLHPRAGRMDEQRLESKFASGDIMSRRPAEDHAWSGFAWTGACGGAFDKSTSLSSMSV